MPQNLKKPVSLFAIWVLMLGIMAPLIFNAGCLSFKFPEEELEGLIQDLQDAAGRVSGEAGVQIRQTVTELTDQMTQVLDYLKSTSDGIKEAAKGKLMQLLEELKAKAGQLKSEIDKMIEQDRECLDRATAERMAQIKDSITEITGDFSAALGDAIGQLEQKKGMIIEQGQYNVKVFVSSLARTGARIVIIVLILIFLFLTIKVLWSTALAKIKALKYTLSALLIIFLGLGIILLAKPSFLNKYIGTEVALPDPDYACRTGGELYEQFLARKNSGAGMEVLKNIGQEAIGQLNICVYSAISPDLARATQSKINSITALLYPPPDPPSPTDVSDCISLTGSISFHPAWFSRIDLLKVEYLGQLTRGNMVESHLIPSALSDTTVYFMKIRNNAGINPENIISRRIRTHVNP
nr:apolipoprotein A1/A4/E family protein [candidate division Zixibacteria bacterium]